MSRPVLRPKLWSNDTKTHDASSMEIDGPHKSKTKNVAQLQPEGNDKHHQQRFCTPEDGLYNSEHSACLALNSIKWNAAVVSSMKDDATTAPFICFYCSSSSLSHNLSSSRPSRRHKAGGTWHGRYALSDGLGAFVFFYTQHEWRQHMKAAHTTASPQSVVGALSPTEPTLAGCNPCEINIDVGRNYMHHVATHLQPLAFSPLIEEQYNSDLLIEPSYMEEQSVLCLLPPKWVSGRPYDSAWTTNAMLSPECSNQSMRVKPAESMTRQMSSDSVYPAAKGCYGVQFNSANEDEQNLENAHFFHKDHPFQDYADCHNTTRFGSGIADSICSEQDFEPIWEIQNAIYEQGSSNIFDSELQYVLSDGIPLYDVQNPSIIVSDAVDCITLPFTTDNDYSLSDRDSDLHEPASLTRLLCKRVYTLNAEWHLKLSSDQEVWAKFVVLSAPPLLKDGLRTMRKCFDGILPSKVRDVFAMVHVTFAISSTVHAAGDSCYWNAFCSDVLKWQQVISNPFDVALFTKIWTKIWHPRSHAQESKGKDHIALSGSSASSASLNTFSMPMMPEAGRFGIDICTDANSLPISRNTRDIFDNLTSGLVIAGCLRFFDSRLSHCFKSGALYLLQKQSWSLLSSMK